MPTHTITLSGCDDTTYVDVAISADQLALLKRIAAQSVTASSYGCQPTMSVYPFSGEELR